MSKGKTMTGRRREVLHWMARGKSNEEIAAILGLAGPTIKQHVTFILKFYGCPNRISAVMRGLSRGHIDRDALMMEFA